MSADVTWLLDHIGPVQVAGARNGDDLVRIGRIDRDRLNSRAVRRQFGPFSAGVAPEVGAVRRIVDARARDGGGYDIARPAGQGGPTRSAIRALINAVAIAGGENGLGHAVDHAADGRIEENAGDAF